MKKVVALVLVVALVVTGVALGAWALLSDDSSPTPASPAGPATGGSSPSGAGDAPDPRKAPDPALQEFYDQELEWSSEDCDEGAQCAMLEVPVDYADPEGETIEIALLRLGARGERVGSMVVNPGGPGAPGTDYAAQGPQVFRQPLLDSFDIVGFDPRGTGDSSPVDCLTDEELDSYIASDPDPDNAAEVQELKATVRDFGEGCVERTGDLINHVTTLETARDMDVLRAALDEPYLTYFGASYGTKLGATFAELFPDRVGRFVLDGAVDVSLDSRAMTLQQAEGFETALTAYVEDCIAVSSTCFLGDTPEEGLATIKGLLEDVESEPLPAGDRELAAGNAFYGIITPLYNRDYWYILSAGLRAALDGNGAPLMQLADIYAARGPSGYTDNSMEAIYAINCLDDPSAVPAGKVPAQYDDFEEASPTFGRIFAWSLTGCAGLQAESTVERPDIRGEGAAPILVVGTTRDPATPYAWAEALADQLESGVLLSRDGDGHTGYNSKNTCVDQAVERYLVEGVVPDDGTEC